MTTILIVDDSVADQFYYEMVLKNADPDIEIIPAHDGLEALEILENLEKEPDLILLDINMPRMNGHDFLENYYKDSSKDTPVVVMLTSSDQKTDKEKVEKYPSVKEYVIKPLTDEIVEDLGSKFFK